MAHGVAYLHSRDIIHRDIKPSNVLLDGDLASGHFVVKVSDFGVATTHALHREDRTAETGTYRWMAPEVIRHEAYSHMADVYSYALVLWQLLTRENPFADVSPISAAGKVALEYARPPFPLGTPTAVQEFIATCWQEVPEERLPFERISDILATELLAMLTPEETVWLESSHGHSVYARKLQMEEAHRASAPVPHPLLPPPPTPVSDSKNNNHPDGNSQNLQNHRQSNKEHAQPLPQPPQLVEKLSSFRRIFPKPSRN
jgi:serine/threonine protein kinase